MDLSKSCVAVNSYRPNAQMISVASSYSHGVVISPMFRSSTQGEDEHVADIGQGYRHDHVVARSTRLALLQPETLPYRPIDVEVTVGCSVSDEPACEVICGWYVWKDVLWLDMK